jgi:PTS system mannose-specific IID component
MARLTSWDLFRMALRASLIQATWNYERQQGLGWAYGLEPALERLVPDPRQRATRLAEQTSFFNTQPTLASVALGAAAALEEQRVLGGGPDAAGIERIKSALGASLAALGDRLFWLTLRPFAATLGAIVALDRLPSGAVVLWVCYNALHLTLRGFGVGWGYRRGPAVLSDGLREALERLTRLIALVGSAALGVLIAMLLAPGGDPRPLVFQIVLMSGIGVGFVVAQRPRPSPTEWALGAAALCVAASWMRGA